MIQVYRIESKPTRAPEILYSEVSETCALKKKEEGYQITYDLLLSEKSDSINNDDVCEICGGSFFVDGRKLKLKGHLKSDIWSIC